MTTEQINRRFAELSEISWHEPRAVPDGESIRCVCGEIHWKGYPKNPDYCADPRLVLEVMMKRKDSGSFISDLTCRYCNPAHGFIENYLLDKTGKLVLAAIKWMEEKK